MQNILLVWFKLLGIVSVVVFACLYLYHRLVIARYWSKRNIPHVKPNFLLGTLWKANILENIGVLLGRIHLENRKKKIIGVWTFHKPNLLVMDVDIIRRILISDFNCFRDRGIDVNEDLDPLAGHLFLLDQKRWRNLRVKLTPTFSSGKMKMMFPTMLSCAEQLREYLKGSVERKEVVEVKELLARFTTDIIGSCAFGIEMNSLNTPKSEFREYGKRIFNPGLAQLLKSLVSMLFPKFARVLKIRLLPKDLSDFFIKVVDDTIKFREKTQTVRNDFLQLLIQLMRVGKVQDVDKTPVHDLKDEEIVQKFSLHEAAAQCFVFFAAGFETSSTGMTFALYEMALNPDIQTRLQNEIDAMLESTKGAMVYENVIGLEYLDMVVQETLRKYPPVGNLQRKSLKEYHIPELNVTLDKGTSILVAVNGIHKDPDIYPDPEKFDPERFSPEEKSKRGSCMFLPFGEGPRNCIGNRFGLMQMKVGLISVLRDYNVEVTNTTRIPLEFEKSGFVIAPKGGMNLLFTKRR